MNEAFLVAAIASLVMACSAWILDVSRVVCAPDSWLQGHAMWHVLMAAVIGWMYLYYRSEGTRARPDRSTNRLSLAL